MFKLFPILRKAFNSQTFGAIFASLKVFYSTIFPQWFRLICLSLSASIRKTDWPQMGRGRKSGGG